MQKYNRFLIFSKVEHGRFCIEITETSNTAKVISNYGVTYELD